MDEKEIKGIKLWKIILIIIIIFLIVLTILFINRPKKEIKKDLNLNFNNQIVNELSFEKIKIYSKNGNYFFTAKVINKNDYDINLSPVTVILDESITFTGYIGDTIKSNEYKMLTMQTKEDLSQIKNIRFEMKK